MSIDDIEKIIWPSKPTGISDAQWQKNIAVVELLCRVSNHVTWIGNKGEFFIPSEYVISGVRVMYTPDLLYFQIEGIMCKLPETELDLQKMIAAVRVLIPYLAGRSGPVST